MKAKVQYTKLLLKNTKTYRQLKYTLSENNSGFHHKNDCKFAKFLNKVISHKVIRSGRFDQHRID